MVLEQILQSDDIKKHALFVFFVGILYVLIGWGVSAYFFGGAVSVAMLFTTTLLLTPSMYVILKIEENIASKEGARHFFHNHKDIFKIYFSLFLGIFAAFFFLSYIAGENIFDYQMQITEDRGDLNVEEFKTQEYEPSFERFSAFVSVNLLVVIFSFVLSVFYGAGALFLIVFNASVFAAFISHIIKITGNAFQIFSIFLIHMVPEITGFLVAAIAGGVVSRAITREEFGSKGFRNVMRDALVLLLIAAGLIIIGAFFETYVTPVLVKGFI